MWIIDGDSSGIAVMINNTTSSSLLQGFTIQNGSGSSGFINGAGVYCDNCVTVLKNLTVTGNDQDQSGDGSGIYSIQGNVTIENVSVTNNTGYFGAVGLLNGSTATLNNVTISDNVISVNGGGLYIIQSSTVTISNSEISSNTTGSDGGGIYSVSSSITISNSTINDNIALNEGGAIRISENSLLEMSNSIVENNQSGSEMDGLYSLSSSVSIINSVFKSNGHIGIKLDGNGPSESLISKTLVHGHSQGIMSAGGDLTVDKSTIVNNSAMGINFYTTGTRSITNSIIYNNGYANENLFKVIASLFNQEI